MTPDSSSNGPIKSDSSRPVPRAGGDVAVPTEEELEATVVQLTEIVSSGAYERHAGALAPF